MPKMAYKFIHEGIYLSGYLQYCAFSDRIDDENRMGEKLDVVAARQDCFQLRFLLFQEVVQDSHGLDQFLSRFLPEPAKLDQSNLLDFEDLPVFYRPEVRGTLHGEGIRHVDLGRVELELHPPLHDVFLLNQHPDAALLPVPLSDLLVMPALHSLHELQGTPIDCLGLLLLRNHSNNHYYLRTADPLPIAWGKMRPLTSQFGRFVGGCMLGNEVQSFLAMRILVVALMAVTIAATSTLTSAHCPKSFAAATYNYSLAGSESDLSGLLYASIFSAETQAAITDSLTRGDFASLTAQATSMSFLLPFILVGSCFFLLFFCTICCCTFERRCPPCESWRRNYLKQPYSKWEMRIGMAVAVLFSAGILVATIVVFSSFSVLESDLKMVECGMYYSLDVAVSGEQTSKWGGFSQIQGQIGNVTALLNSTALAINTSLVGNEWIKTSLRTLQEMNLNLWTNNNDSTVLSPNPWDTDFAETNGLSLPKITPEFIKYGLGPNITAGTMINDIDSTLQTIQRLADQAYKSYTSALLLSSSVTNVTTNTNNNLQSITVASQYLAQIQSAVQTFSDSSLKTAAGYGIYLMEGVFAFILIGSLVSLLGVVSTHTFDILACKKMVHGGWVVLGCSYFAVLGVLFVMLAIGGLTLNFCNYLGGITASTGPLLTFAQAGSGSAFNKFFLFLDVCFFGDGNILKKFSLSEEMRTVSEVFLNTQTYLNMQNAGNSQYIDMSIVPTRISSWMTVMTKYGSGIYRDSDNANLTESNAEIALARFNELTMQGTPGVNTTCAHDYWVFDSTNCTQNASEALYVPSNNNSNGLYIPPTGTLCIPLSSRLTQTSPSAWTVGDIAYRYLSVRSCKTNSSDAYARILKYARSLTNYRDSRVNLYQSLYDQLSAMLSLASTYNANITAFTAKLNNFFSAVSALNNLVTNQLNGLTISSDCRVMADSVRFFRNMVCRNFLLRSVKIAIACIVLLLLMLGAVLAGSIFGVRSGRLEKQLKFQGAETEGEIFRQDEGERSEQSASSSEEEESQ